jgi:3',5'-cyclic AMP phosphodiesterase CpdA
METVLAPGARRKYRVGMDLIAKTEAQAVQAKTIADTFQKNAFSSWDGGNRLIWQHPPLWVLETVSGGQNTVSGWSPGSLPSVLVSVDINKNPILDTPFNLPNYHPLAININLQFIELEPAVNNKTTGTLTNRAETFK